MGRLAAFSPAVKTLEESVARAQTAEKLGYESVWTVQLPPARDASLVLAAYAAATKRLKLGTGVLPIYTRHPTAMVQMAATLDELSGGRFILGIGVSHKNAMEAMLGLRLVEPLVVMREYVTVLRGALAYKTLLIWPYAVAPAIAGVLWAFLFAPSIGIVTYVLKGFGIDWNWIIKGDQAMALVVIAAVWKQISYNFLFFLAGLQSIPKSLIEAADIQLKMEATGGALIALFHISDDV